MMIWRRLKCPECFGEFAVEGEPRFCPLCAYDTQGADLDEVISSPAIASGRAKSIDGHHRAMEEGAAHRAMLADDPTLKLTNMRDNMRTGDIAAMPVNNAVSQVMDRAPNGMFGFQGNPQQAIGFSAQAHLGYRPNAGVRSLQTLRADHAVASGGIATSERPALETQQPGYRPRV